MRSSEVRARKLSSLEDMMARLEAKIPRSQGEQLGDGLDGLRTVEERGVLIQFWKDVYYGGQDEKVWAAKHPAEYRALQKAVGTVPLESEPVSARIKGRKVA